MSEIRLFSFGFVPRNWAACNGQILQINQNQALFSLLGTTYGGNGQTTFALPDLRARVPMHRGPIHGAPTSGSSLGISGGERAHTLTANEMPMHTHALSVTNSSGTAPQPSGRVLAAQNNMYASPGGYSATLDPQTIGNAGGSQPHENMQPYLVMNYCISLQGIFPSQTGGAGGGDPTPFVGEVRMFAGNFAIAGFEFCDGQLVPISENETLFQLIGTTYGGDGQETFALPNLQSRVPLHQRTDFDSWPMGQMGGVEEVTLTNQQMPTHTHPLTATTSVGNENNPSGNLLAQTGGGLQPYFENPPDAPMASNSVSPTGGSQPHTNLQQYLTINYIIGMYGYFPSPT